MNYEKYSKIYLESELGTKYYHDENGKLHRQNGAAIEYVNGSKTWYRHGLLHREDGPAIDRSDGYKKWFIYGKEIECSSQKEFERLIKLKAFW
jgi:hypothetical protein